MRWMKSLMFFACGRILWWILLVFFKFGTTRPDFRRLSLRPIVFEGAEHPIILLRIGLSINSVSTDVRPVSARVDTILMMCRALRRGCESQSGRRSSDLSPVESWGQCSFRCYVTLSWIVEVGTRSNYGEVALVVPFLKSRNARIVSIMFAIVLFLRIFFWEEC